ncbi:threonine dehydratase [Komarekiella sp. 'clone 1']|uniref:Threonine dehydratase n=1 Tax=Komarekiella delphini-convector SJRDD-AB1 TaxID=2593771 RepID=A0AA40SSJ7_9NOST|nr:threonine dehydratase [Komarekiella delphini-convector]MBD6614465.1 threonine dehydratase [Komarekiella delphini-convector SJRDD-AB1]
MLRITQILRNSFIRLEAFFSVIFTSFSNFARNFFGFFAGVFGFTKPGYFLQSDEAQGIKQTSAKQLSETVQNTTPVTPTTTRRRSNAKIEDYYINMARDVKKN